jgi:hypothetical protein
MELRSIPELKNQTSLDRLHTMIGIKEKRHRSEQLQSFGLTKSVLLTNGYYRCFS